MIFSIPSFIYLLVFLLTFAIWTFVGFFFWIPYLILAISQFSALIFLMAMSVSNADEGDLKDILKSTVEFYPSGFAFIYNTFFNTSIQDTKKERSIVKHVKVLASTFYTCFFWLISSSFVFKDYRIFIHFGIPLLGVLVAGVTISFARNKK